MMDDKDKIDYLKDIALTLLELYEEAELSVLNASYNDIDYEVSDLNIKIAEFKQEIENI